MPIEFGLGKPSIIYAGTVLCLDIAQSSHCQCPDHCHHKLERGTAYKVRDHHRKDAHGEPLVFEVGSTCVKKYDPAYDPQKKNPYEGISKPAVPDLTGGMGSLFALETERPSTRMYPARGQIAYLSYEQSERLLDEAYLMIVAMRLPALQQGFTAPTNSMVTALKDYKRDPDTADLGEVRELRQYFDQHPKHNSGLKAMQICYAMADRLTRFMIPGTPEYAASTRREQPILPRYMNKLRRTNTLPDTAIDHLNRMIARAYPRAKPFKIVVSNIQQGTLIETAKVPVEEGRKIFLLDPNITAVLPPAPRKPRDNGTDFLFG